MRWLCYRLQQIKQVQPCTFSSCSGKALDLAPRYRICGGAFGLRGLCFRSGWLDFAILRNLSGVACHRNHFGRHGERTRKVGREGRCRGMKRHTSLNTLMTCETSVLQGLVSCHIADLSDIHALTQLGRSQKVILSKKAPPAVEESLVDRQCDLLLLTITPWPRLQFTL